MRVLRFGLFEADLRSRELYKNGVKVRLQGQPFQVLAALLERPGEVVTREELATRAWPSGTFVDFDYALNTAIKKIRAALEDDAVTPHYVETIPRVGYRFIAAVSREADEGTRPDGDPAGSHSDPGMPTATVGGKMARRAAVALAAVAAVAALALVAHPLRWNRASETGRTILVVLPFENLSDDPRAHYLSDGFTEELITQLGRLDPQRLAVAARTTAVQYQFNHKSVAEIGRELHAAYLMEGSVRSAGRRMRVTAQLIRVSDQSHVWADNFDREEDDALALESEIAAGIAQQVREKLGVGSGKHPGELSIVDF